MRRQFHADNLFVIPSGAELYGEGNLHRRAHRLKNLADGWQITQQSRAAIALDDFFRRAAQIQINQIKAKALHHARRLGHHLRIAAKQLRRNGMLVFVKMQIALSFLIFLTQNTIGRGELGHDQPASAQVADEAAEDSVGHAGHGREHGGRSDFHAADHDSLRDWLARRRSLCSDGAYPVAPSRIVPTLAHVSILSSVWNLLAENDAYPDG